MALVFWKNRRLRLLFISVAVLFGMVVLLTHLHYSIDALSAFFITFNIFYIAELFFKKERELFYNGIRTTTLEAQTLTHLNTRRLPPQERSPHRGTSA